ncbi:hypothetical protein NZK33_07705 [Cyanobium sp. FGCU-6]|nr:hypothetical protein [Cyanobium sp. FGCU6]
MPLLVAAAVLAGEAAFASSPAAWEALRLRALHACTAETIASGYELLAVEPIDGSGATYEPTEDGVRLRLRVQRPGQAPRRVVCSFRRPLFNPPLVR